MARDSITIGLQMDNQTIDLKIPTAVSIQRLKELLKEALVLVEISLPEQYSLVLRDKPVILSESALVSDHPVGNGDQLVVVPYKK